MYDDAATFAEFKLNFKKKLFRQKFVLRMKMVSGQITKENFNTLVSVSINQYNKSINNVKQKDIDKFRKELQ